MRRVQKIYDTIHAALWAILVAFVLFFVFFVLPKMPEIHLQAEMQRAKMIAAEDEVCCAKLGMGKGTQKHDECLFEIERFRSEVEQRVVAESSVF
jgi:hypothetical protein